MEKRSWFAENGLFYTILAIVLFIHLMLLAVQMVRNKTVVQNSDPPKKIRIVTTPEYRDYLKKQIVQSQDPTTDATPKKSRFLSDKNRNFEKQTVAKKISSFHDGGKDNSPKSLSLSDLSAFDKNHDPFKGQAKASRGVSSTTDYIPDIKPGDLTHLNTTEYKYYGFFHRIRQKLEQFWGRSIQEVAQTLMKEGREVASDHLSTSLEVTLDHLGEIVRITVRGTSGIKELDDAAIDSFNAAGPFPNPPKGLIENGLVKVEWGFVVKTSEAFF